MASTLKEPKPLTDTLVAKVMGYSIKESRESSYRREPCLKVRIGKGAQVWHFEIAPVPKAHAWHCWVERDGPPHLAVFFTLGDALEAQARYQSEIDARVRDGWEVVAEPVV